MTVDTEPAAPSPPSVPPGPTAPASAPAKRHTARWIGALVLLIAAGLIAVLATRPPATVAQVASPLLGKLAPPISGTTADGAQYTVPAAPGHYVVLNFFASWCVPCQNEGPELVKFEFQHQQSGDASVVSAVFDDTVSAARGYQQTLGARWPTLADTSGRLAQNYGVTNPPTTFIIAPDGRVVAHIVGQVTASGLDRVIAAAKASSP